MIKEVGAFEIIEENILVLESFGMEIVDFLKKFYIS